MQDLLFLSEIGLGNWAVKKQAAENKTNWLIKKQQKFNKPWISLKRPFLDVQATIDIWTTISPPLALIKFEKIWHRYLIFFSWAIKIQKIQNWVRNLHGLPILTLPKMTIAEPIK